MPYSISNQEIYDLNNGRISTGDYFIVTGNRVDVVFTAYNFNTVDIYLEKTVNDNSNDIPLQRGLTCTPGVPTTFRWICDEQVYVNDEYPIYRIKVVHPRSDKVISYSNKFKISAAIG